MQCLLFTTSTSKSISSSLFFFSNSKYNKILQKDAVFVVWLQIIAFIKDCFSMKSLNSKLGTNRTHWIKDDILVLLLKVLILMSSLPSALIQEPSPFFMYLFKVDASLSSYHLVSFTSKLFVRAETTSSISARVFILPRIEFQNYFSVMPEQTKKIIYTGQLENLLLLFCEIGKWINNYLRQVFTFIQVEFCENLNCK